MDDSIFSETKKMLDSYSLYLKKVFPELLGRDEYFSLLYLLYGRFSDRNLAEVVGALMNISSLDVYNDIGGISRHDFEVSPDIFAHVEAQLKAHSIDEVIPED